MNFKALMGVTSILTAQFLPSYYPEVDFTYNRFSVSDSEYLVSTADFGKSFDLTINNNVYNLNFGDLSFNGELINTFNFEDYILTMGFIPDEFYMDFILTFNSSVHPYNFESSDYLNLSLNINGESFVIDVSSTESINKFECHLEIIDFSTFYKLGDIVSLDFSTSFTVGSVTGNDDNIFEVDFKISELAFEGYTADNGAVADSSTLIPYLIKQYYYNLGLEDALSSDSTMYDLIYDFISNNLLRSEQDTGGLARILTDTSIVLIFITLIMLLVFVFKWCSHNILGG